MVSTESAAPKKKRITPTQRQVGAAAQLDDGALLELSVRALHALNRRAKEKRDRAKNLHWNTPGYVSDAIEAEIKSIYDLKTAFLDRLVRSGLGRVESMEVESRRHTCSDCARDWVGDSWCLACSADTGEPDTDTWYIVEACGHRFHQPPSEATEPMRAIAVTGEPHDPAQPQREIPDVGLTIEAQFRVIEMMRERLTLQFDGTLGPLLAYLRQFDGGYGDQPNKEGLVLRVGREFVSQTLTADELAMIERAARFAGVELDEFPRKQCFANSQRLALFDMSNRLTYVEGFVWVAGIPIHHGWVSLNGKVIDVTLRDRKTGEPIIGTFEDRAYYGIPFLTGSWRARALETAFLGTLLEHPDLLDVDEAGVVVEIRQ